QSGFWREPSPHATNRSASLNALIKAQFSGPEQRAPAAGAARQHFALLGAALSLNFQAAMAHAERVEREVAAQLHHLGRRETRSRRIVGSTLRTSHDAAKTVSVRIDRANYHSDLGNGYYS